jgi:hypothetical protein
VVSCGLVAAASAAVVGGAPAAVGSGIPEVMAYLNGCMVSKASPLGYWFLFFPPHDSCSGSASDGTPLDVIDEHARHACANMHTRTIQICLRLHKRKHAAHKQPESRRV